MDFAVTLSSFSTTPFNWVLEVKIMQRIAAPVPDIAALPVDVSIKESNLNSSNEQFKHLLKGRDFDRDYAFQPVEPRRPAQVDSTRDRSYHSQQSATSDRPSGRTADNREPRSEHEKALERENNEIDRDVAESAQSKQTTEQRPDADLKTAKESKKNDSNEAEQGKLNQATDDHQDPESLLSDDELEDDVDWLALLKKIEENALASENAKKSGVDTLSDESENLSESEKLSHELIDALATEEKGTDQEGLLDIPIELDNQSLLEPLNVTTDDLLVSEDSGSLLNEFAKILAQLKDNQENGDRADLLAELRGLLAQLLNTDKKAEGLNTEATQDLAAQEFSEFDLSLLSDLLGEDTTQMLEAAQLGLFDETLATDALDTTEQPLLTDTKLSSGDPALDKLLNLDPEKLDIALKNLADRLNEQALIGQKDSSTQAALIDDAIPAIAVKLFSQGDDKANFIANMKYGLKEMANQLKQGHEPGINLKSLVEDSLNKSLPVALQQIDVQPAQLDAVLQSFTQALDLSSQLRSQTQTGAHLMAGLERGNVRELGQQAQVEQARQAQLQTSFDKAVNINRPEGHIQLADKVRWMINQNNLQADIRLDPPELGSMKVKVQVNGEAVTVNFVVQSQQARETFEHNAPRLKELLEEQGIQLGQSSVQQEQNDADKQEGELAGQGGQLESEQKDDNDAIEQPIINGRVGGIDYFV